MLNIQLPHEAQEPGRTPFVVALDPKAAEFAPDVHGMVLSSSLGDKTRDGLAISRLASAEATPPYLANVASLRGDVSKHEKRIESGLGLHPAVNCQRRFANGQAEDRGDEIQMQQVLGCLSSRVWALHPF